MSVGVLFCKKLNKNVYRELIGQQTARQPMEKYNVHLTFKSEKKIIAKILKLIIKPIAKVSFLGNQHPLPFAIVSIPAICIQSDFGIMHNTPKNNAFTKVCFASLNLTNLQALSVTSI